MTRSPSMSCWFGAPTGIIAYSCRVIGRALVESMRPRCIDDGETSTAPPAGDEHAVGVKLVRPERQLRLRLKKRIRVQLRMGRAKRLRNRGRLSTGQSTNGV